MDLLRSLLTAFPRERRTDPAVRARGRHAGTPSGVAGTSLAGTVANVDRAIDEAARQCEAGHFGAALALLNPAFEAHPDSQDLSYAKACALFAWGRYSEAHRLFTSLKQAGFHHPGLAAKLGWTSLVAGDLAVAVASMREAVASAPGDWQSRYGLGAALRASDPRAGKAEFAAALAASPDNLHCLIDLSACELADKNPSVAEAHARRALEVSDDSPAAWTNLGVALLMQDRLAEAHEAFARGERCASDPTGEDGEDTEDLNRGIVLRLLGRTREAIEYYEHALPTHPSTVAHGHYALALLTAGRFPEGWDQYEFRWLEGPLKSQRARCDRPAWNGQDLRGKTVLLRCEQGAGDAFQFVRYAPLVKARGATVLLELRPGLGFLAEAFPGIDRAIRPGEASPDFDFYADLMSLPRVFGTTLHSIPADVPYLHAPADVRAPWRDRLARESGLKVGLVWAGDPKHARDRQRSIPLATLSSLIEVEGTRWFSLQKGRVADASRHAPFDGAVVDLAPELYEYADTAAAIENLDLVVTVDTSVAHLAGALGKPVWVLLPHSADWRWMEDRDDSPWYPTMRLFRQRVPDQWEDVVERLRCALIAMVAGTVDGPTCDATTPTGDRGADVAGSRAAGDDPSQAAGLSRACRTRYGMMQYLPSPQSLARSIEHYGEYLQAQVDVLQRLVVPGSAAAVIDAGIGLDALALASLVGPQGQVFAIERSKVLRRILRQNLAANDVKGVSVMTQSHADATLDELHLEQLDLLKVGDPAGVPAVLDGAERTLWRRRPVLFLAQPSREALEAQARQLRDFGYRCWCVASPLFNPANFNRRDDDVFPGQVALALLALPEETELAAGVREMAGISATSRAKA